MENKLKLLLALQVCYATRIASEKKENESDTKRLARIAAGIDQLTDVYLDDNKIAMKSEKTQTEQKPVTQQKTSIPPAPPAPRKEEKTVEKKEEKKEEDEEDKALKEALVEVTPMFSCKVLAKNAKYPKNIQCSAPRTFLAFKDEESRKQLGDVYPTVDELDLVFDEAWDMACKAQSTKKIVDMFRKEIGEYYPELKSDSDWYAKIANPISQAVIFIKKTFGQKSDDPKVTVTRPTEPDMVLTHDADLGLPKEEKVVEKKVEAKTEEKKELKTVQGPKTDAKKEDKRVDEEVQENTPEVESDDMDLIAEEEEEVTKRNTNEPPAVNSYDNFNKFETMILGKMVEKARLAASAKSDDAKKAIHAESREETRNLIAAYYEDEPWVESIEEGKWNPKLILYHQALVKEIQANRNKWPKA